MVFDNAAEHHSAAIQQGAARLGIIPSPTEAYSPWQNGKAERLIGLVNQKLAAKCPGATARQAGTGPTGSPRFVASSPRDIEPGDVLTWRAFEVLLEALRSELNTRYSVQRLGGLTRAQAWAADQTVLAEVETEVAAQAMLKAAKAYAVNGDGIHFANHIYVAPEMTRMRGQWVKVRHFPTNTDWIEVFGLDDEHLFRAFDTDRLTHGQKAAYNAARRAQDADNRALQAGVVAHRRQLAATLNDLAGEDAPEHTEADAAAAAGDARRRGGDSRAAAARRPALPRAGRPEPTDEDAGARASAVARLAARNEQRAIEAGPLRRRRADARDVAPALAQQRVELMLSTPLVQTPVFIEAVSVSGAVVERNEIVLLDGPAGTGKTTAARYVAQQCRGRARSSRSSTVPRRWTCCASSISASPAPSTGAPGTR
jgi:hypothetical protein